MKAKVSNSPRPFFPDNPLDKQKPKPDSPLDDKPDSGYDDCDEDYDCPVCSVPISKHSIKQIVECALMEIQYPQGGEKR